MPGYYDPQDDAVGALALGGIGALGGLGYSLLNKKQRKNKLRNAIIGGAALPALYIGSKALAKQFLPKDYATGVDAYDPIYRYISGPIQDRIWSGAQSDKYHKAEVAYNKAQEEETKLEDDLAYKAFSEDKEFTDFPEENTKYKKAQKAAQEAALAYDKEYGDVLNKFNRRRLLLSLGSYGTLAGGLGIASAYWKYLRDKKLREEDPETLAKEEEMRRRLEQWFYGR